LRAGGLDRIALRFGVARISSFATRAEHTTTRCEVQEVIVSNVRIVLTTIGEDRADELARTLVDERLAACVNVHGPMMSTYRWKGTVEREPERQVFIKTSVDRLAELEARLRQIHPYELPELIVLTPESASVAYEAWVRDETRAMQP
jgi:periplasmic divalent cation tolerance protein